MVVEDDCGVAEAHPGDIDAHPGVKNDHPGVEGITQESRWSPWGPRGSSWIHRRSTRRCEGSPWSGGGGAHGVVEEHIRVAEDHL